MKLRINPNKEASGKGFVRLLSNLLAGVKLIINGVVKIL